MNSIEERIVKMVFDNSQFESKVSTTIGSINKLNETTEKVGKNSSGLSTIGKAFEQTEITATKAGFHIQDVWLKMASIFEYQIAGKLVDAGKKIANALTLEGITDGFREYELKMGSIQTIMAGTGESLATVNQYLEELNTYSDKTIYSFADMTNNIGKFTNAGVKLKDAVAAIKGIANEAAISGANAQEASRAMYNFSQALSAGYVKLIDWKSIENANMATKGFKETLLEVASTVGTVEKQADGMYKVLTTNAQGKTMDELVSGTKNFNDSLQQQWMTTEVLTKALKIYATDVLADDVTQAEKEAYEAELRAMGLTEEQIKQFEELGHKATLAASEVKTFSMLMDTLKEAIGSGWAMTWQYLIGDFEQAKSLWTEVSDVLGKAINDMSDARNNLIKGGLQTGWEKFITIPERAIPDSEKYRDTLLEVAVAHGKLTQEQADGIDSTEKLVKSFHDLNWVTGDILKESVDQYYQSLLKLSDEEKEEAGLQDADIERLGNLSKSLQHGALDADEFAKSMGELGGRENIIQGLKNAFQALVNVIKPISQAFRDIFPPMTVEQLYNMTVGFKEFTAALIADESEMGKIRRTAKGFFSILDIGLKVIKAVINGILPLTSTFGDFAGKLLDTSAELGDFFTELDQSLTEDNVFTRITESIQHFIEVVSGYGAKAIASIKGIIDSIKNGESPLQAFADAFSWVTDLISRGIDNLRRRLSFLEPVVTTIGAVLKAAGRVISSALTDIANSIKGISADDGLGGSRLVNMLNALFGGGLLYNLFKTSKDVSSIIDVVEKLGDVLKAFQAKVQSEALLNIAKAVGILAASIVLIAMIDDDALLRSVEAIGAMVGILSGAMAGLMYAVNKFSSTDIKKSFTIFGKEFFGMDVGKILELSVTLGAVSKALIAMGASVLMLSVSLKIIASVAEGGHLWDSFAVLTAMLTELTIVSIVLGKFSSKANKGVANLKGMALALIGLSAALAIIAKVVEGGHAWEALGILSIMLAELAGIAIAIEKFGKYELGSMGGLIAMAVAINLMVFALKETADAIQEHGDRIGQALLVITAILAELTAVMLLMSEVGVGAALGGVGALLAAAAILIFVQAIKQISDALGETDQHIWQSLGVIAASLGILALGLTAMSASLPGAAALLIASVALISLGSSLKIFASMDLKEVGVGLLALAGMFVVLAGGLMAMSYALPGALALTIASVALIGFATALKILSTVNVSDLGSSLLVMAAAIGGFALISVAVAGAVPVMLALSLSILTLGTGLISASIGLTLFSAALQSLVAVLPLGVPALKQLVTTIMELVPVVIGGIMDGLGVLYKKVIEYGPYYIEAIKVILLNVLEMVIELVPKYAEAVLTILNAVADVIIKFAPKYKDVLLTVLTNIANLVMEFIPTLKDLILTVLTNIANLVIEFAPKYKDVLLTVLTTIANLVIEFVPKLKEMILTVLTNIAELIIEFAPKYKDTILTVLMTIAGIVIEFIPKLGEIVQTLLDTVLGIIVETVPKIVDVVITMAIAIIEGLTEKIPDIAEVGTNFMIALMQAISEKIPVITDEAYKCAIALIHGLADTIDNNNEELIEAVDHLLEVITEAVMQWLEEFTPLGKLLPKNMGDGVTDGDKEKGGVSNVVAKMLSGILKSIGDKWDDFKKSGENLIKGFWSGLKGAADDIGSKIGDVAGGFVRSFNSRRGLDEASPSKKTRKSAIYFVRGFVNGISEAAPDAIKSASSLGGKLSEALQDAMDMASDIADNSMELNPVITPVLDLDNLKNAANDINGTLDISTPVNLARNTSVLFSGRVDAVEAQDSNDKVVNAINKLSDNMHSTMNSLKNMQVVMDSGTLVGELAAPMDTALGRNMTYKQRGM